MRRPQEVDLSKAALRGRDLVVFSNDWDGDPLSKVHIMRILSRDNRVLWVNSIGNRAPKANAHDAARIFKKPNSWSFLPASAPVSGTLGEETVVYHCVDEFSAFSDTNGKHIADLEDQ